ncbi:MAG: histidinol-phosphate transaminase [Gemmatimonadota bacterium]
MSAPSVPSAASAALPALPDPAEGLALIKGAVQALPAYTLSAPVAPRKLNQNESPFDFPDELKREVLERAARMPWNRYPAFFPAELAARLATHYGWRPDGLLVGNGSNELIQASLSVALAGGDVVVAPAPTFSLYRLITGVLGGRYVPVPFDRDFQYDVDRLIDVARREEAKVIVLNSPNNPTGSALPDDAVEQVLEDTDALVLCDEAYQEFGGPTAVPLLERSSRVVVLRTFSKAMGLAGLRFGVALAHPAVAREIAKAKLPYNVNLVTLAAAGVALDHAATLAERVARVRATRDRTHAQLSALPGLKVYPSAANFLLVRFLARPAREVFRRLIDDCGILIRDVSGAAELHECLRISVGTEEDMDAVIQALGEILGGER